jgi:hypothetical protein
LENFGNQTNPVAGFSQTLAELGNLHEITSTEQAAL